MPVRKLPGRPGNELISEPPPRIGGNSFGGGDPRCIVKGLARENEMEQKQVERNDLTTSCCRCNSSIQPMITPFEAKGSTYYQGNYMAKNPFELNRTLPLLLQATEANKKYGSVAGDHGSASRKAKNLLQKALNKQGWSEIGNQQAASSVLGEKSYFSTHKFTFFVWDARREWLMAPDQKDDCEDILSEVSSSVETEAATGKLVGITQFQKYDSRGEDLAKICLYDYAATIVTKKLAKIKKPL